MPQPDPSEAPSSAESAIPKHVTAAYLMALTLIAFLACAAYYLLDTVIADQLDAARIIGVVGHQIMLLQRIGLLATDLKAGTVTARAPLLAALSDVQTTEDTLATRRDPLFGRTLSPAGQQFFFRGPDPLDDALRAFISTARHFADPAAHGSDRAYRWLESNARDTLQPRLIASLSNFERKTHQRVERLRTAQQVVLAMLLVALVLQAMFIFRPLVVQTRHYAAHLYRLATSDDLTGLSSRRHFMETAERDLRLARRSGKQIAAILLDLDHFKEINDAHGHAVGDAVLRRFGEISAGLLRQSDLIGRTGGEEFAILLPDTDLEGAMTVAEKLRRAVAEDRGGSLPPVTVSVGVAALRADDHSIDDLLRRADKALYQAKSAGRNRVVPSPERLSGTPLAHHGAEPSSVSAQVPASIVQPGGGG